jgi:hypothetical protein
VFWSKIWFFVVAVIGAVAVTFALTMPRPAERVHSDAERDRLAVACSVVGVLLKENATTRVKLAGTFAREDELSAKLDDASSANEIDQARAQKAGELGKRLIEQVEGQKPDFAIMIDRRGRVLARVNIDGDAFGDVVAGRPLVDDALAGYLRDDLWLINERLYLVAASPVVRNATTYVGAVVLGHAVTNDLAAKLAKGLKVDVGFYVNGEPIASTSSTPLDRDALQKSFAGLAGEMGRDCESNPPKNLRAGSSEVTALVARLPGEAERASSFYTIFITRPTAIGFMGTLQAVEKGDISFDQFPWILVGGGLVIALVLGLGLMVLESDRPLRRLNAEAVRLAKGEIERLAEDGHRGKFGSIARSINIHIDKLGRDAKAAKKDLDQLLGPVPEGSLGAIDLLGTAAMPGASRPGPSSSGPATPPPPSQFRFGDSGPKMAPPPAALDLGPGPATATPRPSPAGRPPIRAPGLPGAAQPRAPTPPPTPRMLDEDILDSGAAGTDGGLENPYFREVFDQFVSLKRSCGENVAGLTYAKFSEKLKKNRDELMSKTGCREVKFTVYVKDGKAALKATPVKAD